MKEYKKSTLLTRILTFSLFLLVTSAGAIGTQAYLVKGSDKLINRIIPGKVSVVVSETQWDLTKTAQFFPGQIEGKNPAVTNTGTLPAWMFLKVQIPIREIITVDSQTHRKKTKEVVELVSFQVKEGWELMEKQTLENCVEYVYGYQTTVKPKDTTECLFEQIIMTEYLEGEIEPEEIIDIPVFAVAIQNSVTQEGIKEAYRYALGGEQR